VINESISAVVDRNVVWTGNAASQPYEAGWAREAVVFVRALGTAEGQLPPARLEISPDGLNWVAEGTMFDLPRERNEVTFARMAHFGGWVRVAADMGAARLTVLVTIHLKA